MRASELAARPPRLVTTAITFDGEHAFTITFDASKVTRRWTKEADAIGDVYSLYQALCQIITDWDLTNDDGTPYPVTAENMAALNFELHHDAELIEQMVKAAQPSRAEGNASSAPTNTPPSTSTEPQQAYPNGALTSPSPQPSASPSLT